MGKAKKVKQGQKFNQNKSPLSSKHKNEKNSKLTIYLQIIIPLGLLVFAALTYFIYKENTEQTELKDNEDKKPNFTLSKMHDALYKIKGSYFEFNKADININNPPNFLFVLDTLDLKKLNDSLIVTKQRNRLDMSPDNFKIEVYLEFVLKNTGLRPCNVLCEAITLSNKSDRFFRKDFLEFDKILYAKDSTKSIDLNLITETRTYNPGDSLLINSHFEFPTYASYKNLFFHIYVLYSDEFKNIYDTYLLLPVEFVIEKITSVPVYKLKKYPMYEFDHNEPFIEKDFSHFRNTEIYPEYYTYTKQQINSIAQKFKEYLASRNLLESAKKKFKEYYGE